MKNMKNKHGFTLAELLIVVAIIAVLVAISIPIFTSKLESSREAVDTSNMRAAYAIAMTDMLTGEYKDATATGKYTASSNTYTTYYDAANGVMAKAKPTTGYGKSSIDGWQGAEPDLPSQCAKSGNNNDKIIKIVITTTSTEPTAALTWDTKGT